MSDQGLSAVIGKMLQVSREDLEKSLCSRVIAAGGNVVDKHLNVPESIYAAQAFAKVFYVALKLIMRISVKFLYFSINTLCHLSFHHDHKENNV